MYFIGTQTGDKIVNKMSPLWTTPMVIIIICIFAHHRVEGNECKRVIFDRGALQSGQSDQCRLKLMNTYKNLPILNAVYCFNNGTGICKALAGRFEFYLNSWTGEVLGPVESSKWVDSNGYHNDRVPLTYMVNGEVLYADRPINWAIDFTTSQKDIKYNLLSSTSFNWCKYAPANNWPYKSAIRDHDGNTTIYFFNRQSCIYKKTASEPLQHFNTRFMGNSILRIDLDYNPTIFAMEDDLAREVRLVKAHRQHWYEVGWKTKVNPVKGIRYFVEMDRQEKAPCRINMTSPRLIHASGYKRFAKDACISDYYTERISFGNSRLVPTFCGLDRIEIADYLENEPSSEKVFSVGLHNIPRWPARVQSFYGVTVSSDSEWETFAQDGLSFSATTTIEIDKTTYRTLSLLSTYSPVGNSNYDETYPNTYLADYKSKLVGDLWQPADRNSKMVRRDNLNYVDDIAYLHTCKTILVILGPLYTEIMPDEFMNPNIESLLRPINDLGAYEPVTAFFAKDNDKLYFYHRLNFVAEHTYKCASGSNKLVTANAVSNYYYHFGKTSLPWMQVPPNKPVDDLDISEESSFEHIGVFKGTASRAAAPDPTNYEWIHDEPEDVTLKSMPSWILVLLALGVLFLFILIILGCVTFRRKIKLRQLLRTIRSDMPDSTGVDAPPTGRSGLPRPSRGTVRSRSLRDVLRGSSNPTVRSGSSRHTGVSRGTVRSAARENSNSSNRTRRSALKDGSVGYPQGP